MNHRRLSVLALLGLFSGAPGCALPIAQEEAAESDALRSLETEEQRFFDLLNTYRKNNGLGAVTATPLLNQIAYDHSKDMADRNYFDHTNLAGVDPFARMRNAGYANGSGEILAAGGTTGQEAFDQWKNSPGHDAIMRQPGAKAVGIGRGYNAGSTYKYYWTAVFGTVVDGSANGGGGTTSGTGGAQVTLFEHASFGGRSQAVGVGRYMLGSLGVIGNDSVSSVKVPSGLKITLYEHDNFVGRTRVLTEETAWIGSDFNDLASSVVVENR